MRFPVKRGLLQSRELFSLLGARGGELSQLQFRFASNAFISGQRLRLRGWWFLCGWRWRAGATLVQNPHFVLAFWWLPKGPFLRICRVLRDVYYLTVVTLTEIKQKEEVGNRDGLTQHPLPQIGVVSQF